MMRNPNTAASPLRAMLMAALALLVAALVSIAPATAGQFVVDDPNDTTLNLRAGPGTEHRIIMAMRNGTIAALLEQRGDWARIRHESGQTGWAYFHYLIDERPGQPAAMIVQNPRRDDLNTRAGPGTNYRVLNRVRNGNTVLVFARRGDWVWLRMSDGRSLGWAYEPFLIPAPERAPLPPAPPPVATPPVAAQPPTPPVAGAPATPPAAAPSPAYPPQARVVLSAREPYAYLYAGPDDATAILSRWANGTPVTELRDFEGWAEVITPDGARGWMDGIWVVTPEEWELDQRSPAPMPVPAGPPEPAPALLQAPPAPQAPRTLILTGTREIRTRGMGQGQMLSRVSRCDITLAVDPEGRARLIFEPCAMELVDIGEDGQLTSTSHATGRLVHTGETLLDRDAPDLSAQLGAWLLGYFEARDGVRSVTMQPVGNGFFLRIDYEEVPFEGFLFHDENIIELTEQPVEGLVSPPLSNDLERKLRERLQIGHLTEIVEPRDSAGRYWSGTSVGHDIDPGFAIANPYPDMTARMAELGYKMTHDDDGLRLFHDGTEVWSEDAWMLSIEGPRDYTANGWPNLLVFTARGRSFRGTSLLELAEDGVTIIWSVDGHVNEMHPFETELGRVMSEGGSLEQISGAPAPNGFGLESLLPAID